MYHYEYIPEVSPITKKIPRDNHFGKSYEPYGARMLLYGTGCHKWHDCFTCPLPTCTFDVSREIRIRKQNGGNGNGD